MKKTLIISLFLLPLISGCTISSGTYTYKDADKYSEYTTETFITTQVEELTIGWINGNVIVTKGEQFSFSEDSKGKPLYYWNRDNKLDIHYVKNGTSNDELKNFSKELIVTVPYSLKALTIDCVNNDYTVNLSGVDSLNINSVNGDGDIKLGYAKNMSFDLVNNSVNCVVTDTSKAELFDFNSVNASVKLTLDSSRGFDVDFHTINGRLNNNFIQPKIENNKYKIKFDSVNGDLTINSLA